jgi:hypothetical protein
MNVQLEMATLSLDKAWNELRAKVCCYGSSATRLHRIAIPWQSPHPWNLTNAQSLGPNQRRQMLDWEAGGDAYLTMHRLTSYCLRRNGSRCPQLESRAKIKGEKL